MQVQSKGLPRDVYLAFAGSNAEAYGYMSRAIERTSSPEYAPRFGTGKADETDLSLLKAETFTFEAGQYQRKQKDNNRNSILGGYYNRYAEQLEPYRGITSLNGDSNQGSPTAECFSGNYTYIATHIGSTNKIAQISPTGSLTWLTLPSPLGTSSYSITNMCMCKGYLFVVSADSVGNGINVYRYYPTTNTWQDVGGRLAMIATLRGRLYGVSYDGSIWLAPDCTVATISWQRLQDAPGGFAYPIAFYEFNGALWLAYQGSTYRFDGVNLVEVLSHETTLAEVYNGAVYYTFGDYSLTSYKPGKWLYRFNGSVVEKLQYIDDGITALRADHDNLYILTGVSGMTSGYDNIKDAIANPQLISRMVYFDGEGFYTACERYSTNPESGFTKFYYGLSRHATGIVVIFSNAGGYGSFGHSSPLSTYSTPTDGTNSIFTSELNNGFPNNWKQPAYLDVSTVGSYSLTVDVQINVGTGWSNWINLCTAQSSSNRVTFPILESYLYKSMRVRVLGATVDALTLRYTLQPRQRSNFRVDLVIPSDDAFGTKDRLNAKIDEAYGSDATSQMYYDALIRAQHSKIPMFFIGTESTKAIAPAVTTGLGNITLAGWLPLFPQPNMPDESAYLAITNNDGITFEIVRIDSFVRSRDGGGYLRTTVNIAERSISGATISISASTKIAPCAKVFAQRIVRDTFMANGNAVSVGSTSTADFVKNEHVVSLELVEV